jgi:hypothetical protein
MKLKCVTGKSGLVVGKSYEIVSFNGCYVEYKKNKHTFIGMREWFA